MGETWSRNRCALDTHWSSCFQGPTIFVLNTARMSDSDVFSLVGCPVGALLFCSLIVRHSASTKTVANLRLPNTGYNAMQDARHDCMRSSRLHN